jgi:dUTP pyrophosphatase
MSDECKCGDKLRDFEVKRTCGNPNCSNILRVKKLHEKAKLPVYKTEGSVGMDFCSLDEVILLPGEDAFLRTGISVELPPNTEMSMRQRSGLSIIYPNYLKIGTGTIDTDYRGEIKIPVKNNSDKVWVIEKGAAIIQGIVAPIIRCVIEEDELSETERGENGFGHTGL